MIAPIIGSSIYKYWSRVVARSCKRFKTYSITSLVRGFWEEKFLARKPRITEKLHGREGHLIQCSLISDEMFHTMIQPIADANLRIHMKTVIDPTPNTRCWYLRKPILKHSAGKKPQIFLYSNVESITLSRGTKSVMFINMIEQ
jgi:hypothetical protein